jgi:putative SOS response-associated peptidase YedK
MCGRYGLSNPARILDLPFAEHGLDPQLADALADVPPRWNIAPASTVPALAADARGVHVAPLTWGLVPFWAKDRSIGQRLANARDDGVRDKPSFRAAFKARRALVFADLFYEWQVVPGTRSKQPWCARRPDRGVFAFGALWESWTPRAPEPPVPLETFTLITTTPNAVMARVHDRMPVIVPPEAWPTWLEVRAPLDAVQALLAPLPDDALEAWPVTREVNNPRADGPQCAEPLAT